MPCVKIPNGIMCVAEVKRGYHRGRAFTFELDVMGCPYLWRGRSDRSPFIPGERHWFWRTRAWKRHEAEEERRRKAEAGR